MDREIAAFDGMRDVLEAEHRGRWVVIRGGALIGAYPSLDAAADEAMDKFGEEVFLIRQVGREAVSHVPSVFRVK